jgi:hypothetical protein
VVLPEGASPIDHYARHYASRPDGKVVARYIIPDQPVGERGEDMAARSQPSIPVHDHVAAKNSLTRSGGLHNGLIFSAWLTCRVGTRAILWSHTFQTQDARRSTSCSIPARSDLKASSALTFFEVGAQHPSFVAKASDLVCAGFGHSNATRAAHHGSRTNEKGRHLTAPPFLVIRWEPAELTSARRCRRPLRSCP